MEISSGILSAIGSQERRQRRDLERVKGSGSESRRKS